MVVDHLGNEYPSICAMCRAHGIEHYIFRNRRRKGLSLEECLAVGEKVRDHLGNEFANVTAMCRAHGVRIETFRGRQKKGLSLEECLASREVVRDHLGNEFRSLSEMCRYYGIGRGAFRNRLKYGWTLEQALTIGTDYDCLKAKMPVARDHLGNVYASISAMCRHYGIPRSVFVGRMYRGWPLEKALTEETKQRQKHG